MQKNTWIIATKSIWNKCTGRIGSAIVDRNIQVNNVRDDNGRGHTALRWVRKHIL